MGSGTLILRKLGETLNLRTNRDVKQNRSSMSPQGIARIDQSNRRALAASFTGLIINSVLAPFIHPFAIPAVVNAWQTGVGLINRDRTRSQIKRHIKADPRLRALFEDSHHRDVFIGVSVKILTAGVGLGLEDLGNVADQFAKLHHAVPEDQLPSKIIDQIQANHQHLAAADKRIHDLNAGLTDWFRDNLGHALLTGDDVVETETSTEDLKKIHQAGNSTERMLAQAIPAGIASEVVQPVMLSVERGVDAYRSHEFDKRQTETPAPTYTSYQAPAYTSYQTSSVPYVSKRRRVLEFIRRHF